MKDAEYIKFKLSVLFMLDPSLVSMPILFVKLKYYIKPESWVKYLFQFEGIPD